MKKSKTGNECASGSKCFKEEYLRRLWYLFSTEELTQDIDDKLANCTNCFRHSKENGLDLKKTSMCCFYCVGGCYNPKCIHCFNESFMDIREYRGRIKDV